MGQLFYACGRYSRAITVGIEQEACMECGEKEKCISFDSSEGEYSAMTFCKPCIDKFFAGYVSKSNFSRDLSVQESL